MKSMSIFVAASLLFFSILTVPAPSAQAASVDPRPALSLSNPNIPFGYYATTVSLGEFHTCMLTPQGGVKCWGENTYGQLGDGTNTDSSIPVDVVGLTSGVRAIAAGGSHTCALTDSGGVKCWGLNDSGQLGNNSLVDSNIPVDVSTLASGVSAITGGYSHTCALLTDGGVQCWGYNAYGQLGDNSTTDSPVPVDVSSLTSGVSAISAGLFHTCAVTTGGGVKCWGFNGYGQLGNGTTDNSYIPVDVSTLTSGTSVVKAGGFFTCALASGAVKCWGANDNGQLGNSTTGGTSTTPVQVTGLTSEVTSIAAGDSHACAVATDGVKCWGYNLYGQLGDGTTTDSNVPVAVSGLASGGSVVAAGTYHTCVLTTTGGIKCWGENTNGQLGDGTTTDSSKPVDLSIFSGSASAISAGLDHSCGITTSGGVKCWGRNQYGQLGTNSLTDSSTPVDVFTSELNSDPLTGVTAIAAGRLHTCALMADGSVKCWGNNSNGQLGDGSILVRYAPVNVTGLDGIAVKVTAIAASGNQTCALTADKEVKCWGYNNYGQLGDGSVQQRNTPVNVVTSNIDSNPLTDVVAIGAGFSHNCAVLSDGTVKCWGYNNRGQLGDGTMNNSSTPVFVSGLTGISAVKGGANYTCALTTGGGAKCWGDNTYGQLGNNSTTQSSSPVDVVTSGSDLNPLNKVSAVTAGDSQTCALLATGGIKCWGLNSYGQLGNGAPGNRLAPVDVIGLTSGASAVATGLNHTCALTAGGGVKCWGYNRGGQLGNGAPSGSNTPVDVLDLSSVVISTVTAGSGHSCALTTGGGVKCWGFNYAGQVGDNSFTSRATPVDVYGLTSGASAVVAGQNHTCAVVSGGVQCWGDNTYKQLGNDGVNSSVPVAVSGLTNVSAVAAGLNHTCALTTGGGVKCWGYNAYGQLGNGTTGGTSYTPVDVTGLSSGVSAITAGANFTCALMSDGTMKCWGQNVHGQLGNGITGGFSNIPVDVIGLAGTVSAMTAGYNHTCALITGGGVQCWGRNLYGQLGTNSPDDSSTPVDVYGLTSGVSAIAAGLYQTCAITTDGVMCWGYNNYGEIGDGSYLNRFAPVYVWTNALNSDPLTGISSITGGYAHTCAVTTGGGIKCWGRNSNGQLGNGLIPNVTSPVQVINLLSSIFPVVNLTANPVSSGEPASFTASVLGPVDVPGGTVQFKVDGADIGSPVTLASGSATSAPITTLPVGAHQVSFSYSGDVNYLTGTPAGVVQSVVASDNADLSSLVISNGTLNPVFDSLETDYTSTANVPSLTVTPTAANPNSAIKVNGNTVPSGGTSGAIALDMGLNTITVVVTAHDGFTTKTYTLVVTRVRSDTTTTVTSKPNPSTYGQTVIITATVASQGGTPDGTVQFYMNSTAYGAPITLSEGKVSFTTAALDAGTYPITADYSGGSTFNSSTSDKYNQVVNKASASVLIENLSQTYDGGPKSVNVTTDPPGLTVDVTYAGDPTAPTNAGDYAVEATVNDPNYQGSASGMLHIAKANATVNLDIQTYTYDKTPKSVTYTTTPPGLNVAVTYDGDSSAPTNAGEYAVVATVDETNYQGSSSGSMVINKRPIEVTAATDTKTYDGTNSSDGVPSITLGSLVAPDSAVWMQTFDTAQAGTNKSLTPAGTVSDGNGGDNYAVTFNSVTTGVIDLAPLTIQTENVSKVFGDPLPIFTVTYVGFVNGETKSVLGGTLAFDTLATQDSHVGDYDITPKGLTSTNYAITFVKGTLTITPATATVELGGLAQTYTGTPRSATATTTPPGLNVIITYDSSTTPPTDADSYAVVATVSATDYQGSASGTLVISPAPLTIQTENVSKVYGDPLPVFTATYAGFVNGENKSVLGGTLAFDTTATQNSPVGDYDVTPKGLTSTNYAITFVKGTLTITQATATVELGSLNQAYTGTPRSATATTTPPGLNVTFTYDGSATAPTDAGSYAVVATVNETNYQGGANGTLVISQANLTVSGLIANDKVYDGNTTATLNTASATLVGVMGTDDVKLETGSAAGVFADKNVGQGKTVTISGLALSGAKAVNYTLTQPTATASITAKTLSVTADDKSKVYGQAVPALTASYAGFVSGESEALLTGAPVITTSATINSPVATYVISVTRGTLSADNYSFSLTNGSLVVNKANTSTALQLSASNVQMTQPVTLTVAVAVVAPGAGLPAGQVTFKDGTTTLGTATLAGGTASLTTSSLSSGLHNLSAIYGGNANFNSSTSSSAALVVGGSADLKLTMSVSSKEVSAGTALTYTLTVNNLGPSAATGIVVTDTLPAGVGFVKASAGCTEDHGLVTCSIGSLASGANFSVQIVVMVPKGTTGKLVNTAQVSGVEYDALLTNNSTSIESSFGYKVYVPIIMK